MSAVKGAPGIYKVSSSLLAKTPFISSQRALITLELHGIYTHSLIAERLSARQLIVQCGPKSQLAYIYIYMYATCHA